MSGPRARRPGRGSKRPLLGGTMIVYGRNPVREAVRGRRRVLRLWVARESGQGVPEGSPPASIVEPAELDRICGSTDHQGFACEVDPYPYVDGEALLEDPDALVVALDQVQDPHNLGAICRSAECAGAAGVVLPERRSAEVTPAVCRASAGAVEHLPIARVRNLADFLKLASDRGAWIYGAEAGAEASYTDPDYSGRTVLVLGSEGRGLGPRVRSVCDQLVSLPVRGSIESLNVSAAAAVLLYQAALARPQENARTS